MTPEQIADAILVTRFPNVHPGSAFYQNSLSMIVDGIERALAQRPEPDPVRREVTTLTDHDDRMVVTRRVARFHIGDSAWAHVLVGAYLNPDSAQRALEEEMADG